MMGKLINKFGKKEKKLLEMAEESFIIMDNAFFKESGKIIYQMESVWLNFHCF